MSTASDSSADRPHLPALLRLAAQYMSERLARWLADSGFEGIQPAHSAVIQPLWAASEGVRNTELAQMSRITKQSMSALVADLETGGYVERVDDPDDARATRLRLTARGRAYARAVRAHAAEIEAEWERRIGAQRVTQLRATLDLLRTEVFQAEESRDTRVARAAPTRGSRRPGARR